MPGEKSAEASLDWKPNGHTAPGWGIRTLSQWATALRKYRYTTYFPYATWFYAINQRVSTEKVNRILSDCFGLLAINDLSRNTTDSVLYGAMAFI